MLQITSC